MGAVISILLYEDLVNEMFNLFMAKVMALDPKKKRKEVMALDPSTYILRF